MQRENEAKRVSMEGVAKMVDEKLAEAKTSLEKFVNEHVLGALKPVTEKNR